jgi:hypothetical protein
LDATFQGHDHRYWVSFLLAVKCFDLIPVMGEQEMEEDLSSNSSSWRVKPFDY